MHQVSIHHRSHPRGNLVAVLSVHAPYGSGELQEIDVDEWDEFEGRLADLQRSLTGPLLFRGQGDSRWPLETTLERCGRRGMKFPENYERILAVRPQVEAFSGNRYPLLDFPEVARELKGFDALSLSSASAAGAFRYMAYLRHHGFPSPLLDWTQSPRIAAFFAFRESIRDAERASIYVLRESPEGPKGLSSGRTTLLVVGPYLRAHKRHFLQQCNYTICLRSEDELRFAEHERAIAPGGSHEDSLWKFNIPSAVRLRILRLLDSDNLNAFSLFGSEESLAETIAFRELHLHHTNH